MVSQTGSEQSKASSAQYLITILTIAGTLGAATIPVLLNTFSSQISNKPDVNLVVTPNLNHDSRKALTELTNRGSGTATNLSLTIQAPKNISTITNEFSSTDISISRFNKALLLDMHKPKTINQSSLKLYIAKFSAGSGSMIRLETLMDAKDTKQDLSYYNYTVSAAYDQGSIMGKVMKTADTLTFSNLPSKIWQYIIENPILVASEIAIIPAGYITIRWWLNKRFKRHATGRMINSMLRIRRSLMKAGPTVDYVPSFWWELKNIYISIGLFYYYFSLGDWIRIDDLVEILINRAAYVLNIKEEKLRNELVEEKLLNELVDTGERLILRFKGSYLFHESPDEIMGKKTEEMRKTNPLYLEKMKKYDEECLSKINEALEKINWTKY